MKSLLILLSLIVSGLSYSQNVVFLEKNDTLQKPTYQQFIYISDSTDISNSIYVAKIKSVGSLRNVANLYLLIKTQAQHYGANSFKIDSFRKIDSETGELVVSAYYNEDDFFNLNFDNFPKNKIFVFGSQNLRDNRTQSYKLRGEKLEIQSGKYQQFDIGVDEEVKVNKGGFAGMTLFIKRSQEGYSSFLNFSGIGVSGASVGIGAGGGVGIMLNTGSINRIESNLALALMKMYSEQ